MVKKYAGNGLTLLCGFSLWLLAACSSTGGHDKASLAGPDNASCPPVEEMVQAADSDYGRNFLGRVSAQVSYPADALDAGQVGVVLLCARLDRKGRVHDGRIADGSGYPLLDGAALMALGTLESAAEKAPLPDDLAPGQKQVWIAFPVNFKPEPRDGVSYRTAPAVRPCKDSGTDEGEIGAKAVNPEDWGNFPSQFSNAVRKELAYPAQAFEAKVSGSALLCVSLDRDSHLLGVSISRSSGSPLLDGAALGALGLIQLKSEIPGLPDLVLREHDGVTFNQEIDWKP